MWVSSRFRKHILVSDGLQWSPMVSGEIPMVVPMVLLNLQVDFTPDDDDGADVELPGDDAGEDDDMQSFDMDDLEPPGDEDRRCH